jgi:hypothetical protein
MLWSTTVHNGSSNPGQDALHRRAGGAFRFAPSRDLAARRPRQKHDRSTHTVRLRALSARLMALD